MRREEIDEIVGRLSRLWLHRQSQRPTTHNHSHSHNGLMQMEQRFIRELNLVRKYEDPQLQVCPSLRFPYLTACFRELTVMITRMLI
jgi:hypothetical protein